MMRVVKTYNGEGCTATIEKHTNRPAFKGDKVKADRYRVIFKADYDYDFVYHVVCFETLKEATEHVAEYKFFKERKSEK